MPKLIVQQGYYERSEIELKKDQFIIGRDPGCDLPIPDGEVSRQHSRILLENGKYSIEDLNSYNGTFLNWTPVTGRQQLKHLDVLQICKNVFVYNDSSPVEVEDALPNKPNTQESYTAEFLRETVQRIQQNIEKVFMGKPRVVRNVLLCLLADGHVLIEDAPGLGKSILAQAVAKSVQGTYKRIQFTPDMLPSDITGITLYDDKMREFRFVPGPIFGNVILADEINRTTPRTQSSLLECMSEAVVTIDGTAHVLPKPFFVVATQNPSHYHGTYPLPEAQLDRFLMRLSIGYPDQAVEKEILSSQMKSHPISAITYVARTMDLVQCQALVRAT
jgi:MoxR-like ATPase